MVAFTDTISHKRTWQHDDFISHYQTRLFSYAPFSLCLINHVQFSEIKMEDAYLYLFFWKFTFKRHHNNRSYCPLSVAKTQNTIYYLFNSLHPTYSGKKREFILPKCLQIALTSLTKMVQKLTYHLSVMVRCIHEHKQQRIVVHFLGFPSNYGQGRY